MDLIERLRHGRVRYKTGEDGLLTDEIISYDPPTRTELQAANIIESLNESITNLGMSYERMYHEYVQLVDDFNEYKRKIQEEIESLRKSERNSGEV